VQLRQRGTDDTIANGGEPPRSTRTPFVHVQAQDFDEKYLSQFGQHAGSARTRRTGFRQGVAH
jgi:hypothetical protein